MFELIQENIIELRHEISNNVVCATSKASYQPAHAQSDQSLCLPLEYSMNVNLLMEHHLQFLSRRLHRLVLVYTCKHHIVGNHMLWLIFRTCSSKVIFILTYVYFSFMGPHTIQSWKEILSMIIKIKTRVLQQYLPMTLYKEQKILNSVL